MTARTLVRCPTCARQFDASALKPGNQFHCVCGHRVVVAAELQHEARAVHCSSCGGARHKDDLTCTYCNAVFTLHERDLDTLCPGCCARISDAARFCHHCGIKIDVVGVVGATTGASHAGACPACENKEPLRSRSLLSNTVLECNRCAGLWLPAFLFNTLVKDAQLGAPSLDPGKPAPPDPAGAPLRPGPYRPCVECGQLMVRQNFGRRSGVVIDRCSHGVWLDAHECERILAWLRAGNRPRLHEPSQKLPGVSSPGIPTSLENGESWLELVVEGIYEAIF